MTLKGHKVKFYNKATCHLINPAKNKLQQISKKIIKSNFQQKKNNQEIRKKIDINQLKNTSNVINWFKNIKDKKTKLSSNSILNNFTVLEQNIY